MFKNIHYDTKRSMIHLWTQKKGKDSYERMKWAPYLFDRNESGNFNTIDGNSCSKVEFDSYKEYSEYSKSNSKALENNVRPDIQFLSDNYYDVPDDNMETPLLKVYAIDIEVDREVGFPTPELAEDPVTVISIYDQHANTSMTFGLEPYNGKWKDSEFLTYVHCKTESVLLINFFNYMYNNPCDVLTGWYCLNENTNIYLNNKIIKIKDINIGDNIGKYGTVKNKVYTGIKKNYVLKTSFGSIIQCSDDHIFPIYKKLKNKYKGKNTLLNDCSDETVNKIIHLNKDNDVYLQIDKHNNTNKTLTYKNYIKYNIQQLIDRGLNLYISDDKLKERLFEKYPDVIKNRIFDKINKRYWKTTNLWNTDNLKDILHISDIYNLITDSISVIFNKNKYEININKPIDIDDLYLLGMIYTDGHITSKSEMGISNTNIGILKKCMKISNKYRTSKYRNVDDIKKHINIDNSPNPQYLILLSFFNEIGLLKHLIYNKENKKNISIELLSQLSYEQFIFFLSGMIDGDGSVCKNYISLCNYNNDIDNISTLSSYNGLIPIINKKRTVVSFNYSIDANKEHCDDIRKIIRHDKKNKVVFSNISKKNRKSNNIKYMEYDDFILQKIVDINENGSSKMFDIETTSHYFNCNNGIKTHNCESFDLVYLINRTKELFGDNNNVYKKLSPIGVVRTWMSKDDKHTNIDIAGVTILDYINIYKWYSASKLASYKLDFVCLTELGKGKIDYSEYKNLNNLCKENWDLYVEYNIIDAYRVVELEEKLGYIKLVQSLSLLCKAPMKYYHTMTMLIEGLLLTYFRRNDLCAPRFYGGMQESFPAAYVKEPQKGMFDWVVDLDITSSYPTAIITLNMSPETYYGRIIGMTEEEVMTYTSKREFIPFDIILDRGKIRITGAKLNTFNNALKKRLLSIAPCGSVFTTNRPGIIAEVERQLFKKRIGIKRKRAKLIKSLPDLRDDTLRKSKVKIDQYFSTQWALKIVLNATFGITSVPYSRYFNVNLSEAITSCGRFTIKEGERFVNKLLNNPNDDIVSILNKIQKEVGEL